MYDDDDDKEKHPMKELADSIGQLIFWSIVSGIVLVALMFLPL